MWELNSSVDCKLIKSHLSRQEASNFACIWGNFIGIRKYQQCLRISWSFSSKKIKWHYYRHQSTILTTKCILKYTVYVNSNGIILFCRSKRQCFKEKWINCSIAMLFKKFISQLRYNIVAIICCAFFHICKQQNSAGTGSWAYKTMSWYTVYLVKGSIEHQRKRRTV